MDELGYRPHRAARVLRTGQSQVIGVVVATLESVGNSLMLQAVSVEAARRGLTIALVVLDATAERSVERAISQLRDQDVDGAIVVNEAAAVLAALGATDAPRLVLVDAEDVSQFPTVRSDHEGGARRVTALLADRGVVHHVSGPVSSFAAAMRERGWREALVDARLDAPEPIIGDWTSESGHAAGVRLAADPAVRAVFCANDQMALGVMSAMLEAGRAVPDDVAVAGFDGIADGARFWPSLTTVEQDFGGLAVAALDLLTSGAESSVVPHVIRPTRLVERASTG